MELSCIVIDDEPHAISQVEQLIAQTPGISLTGSFENAYDAIEYLHKNGQVDVVFSDINMPHINGIEAGKILNTYCNFLVYVTAHRDYGTEAFQVEASGYLVKPLLKQRFFEQVEKLLHSKHERSDKNPEKYLFVKGDNKNTFIKIAYADIIYIQAMLNYVRIVTTKNTVTTYKGLNEMEKELRNNQDFLRINRSVIISLGFLDHVDGFMVYLSAHDLSFSVGKTYQNAFMKYLNRKTGKGR